MGTSLLHGCHHPRLILNKSTNHFQRVNCGKCSFCLNHKADILSQLCSIEENFYNYTLFVTLTYDNEHIPCFTFEETSNGYNLLSLNPRVSVANGTYINSFDNPINLPSKKIQSLLRCSSVTYKGQKALSFAPIRDIQLFLKRVRKQLSSISDEKIKYFCVSEYGPEHLRAHWHLLIYFNCPKLKTEIKNVINTCWQYGFTCASFSRRSTSSYLASYVNSFTSIPPFYSLFQDTLSPRCVHSNFFGYSPFLSQSEEIFKNTSSLIDGIKFKFTSSIQTIHCSRSLQNYFFPKLPQFNALSDSDLYRLYHGFGNFLSSAKELGLNNLSKIIRFLYDRKCFLHTLSYTFNSYCRLLFDVFNLKSPQYATQDSFFNRFYSILIPLKRFYNFTLQFYSNFRQAYDSLICFYRSVGLNLLKQFYQFQEDFCKKYPISTLSNFFDFACLYDNGYNKLSSTLNIPSDLSLSDVYNNSSLQSVFLSHDFKRNYDRTKYKKLNDKFLFNFV